MELQFCNIGYNCAVNNVVCIIGIILIISVFLSHENTVL